MPWNLIRLVPLWAYPLIALLVALGVQSVRLDAAKARERAAVAELRREQDQHEDMLARAKEQADARLRRIIDQQKAINDDTAREIEDARAAHARATVQLGRLSAAAQALRQRISSAAAAGDGQTAGAASGVLTDVLEQCRGQLVALASFADRSSAAGAACERAYGALTEPQIAKPE